MMAPFLCASRSDPYVWGSRRECRRHHASSPLLGYRPVDPTSTTALSFGCSTHPRSFPGAGSAVLCRSLDGLGITFSGPNAHPLSRHPEGILNPAFGLPLVIVPRSYQFRMGEPTYRGPAGLFVIAQSAGSDYTRGHRPRRRCGESGAAATCGGSFHVRGSASAAPYYAAPIGG